MVTRPCPTRSQSDGLIPELGNLSDLVQVRAIAGSPFIAGTSGSAWRISNRPAAIEVGRDVATSTQGLAQFLDTQLFWVRHRLSADGPLDFFRFVQLF